MRCHWHGLGVTIGFKHLAWLVKKKKWVMVSVREHGACLKDLMRALLGAKLNGENECILIHHYCTTCAKSLM